MNWEYFFIIARRMYPIIASVYAVYITFRFVSDPVKVQPVTAVVTCSGDVVFSNDPNSSWQKPILKDRMKELLTILWRYQKEDFKGYASRYADFRVNFKKGSEAARIASNAVIMEIGDKNGPIKDQSSDVEIDWNSFESSPMKGGSIAQVNASRVTGNDVEGKKKHQFKLRVTFVEGEHNAIYQIADYKLVDLEQPKQ